MLSQFVDCSVVDHRNRLLATRESVRLARCTPPRPLRVRVAAVRANIGFRLVEAGLRIALDQRDAGLGLSRSGR